MAARMQYGVGQSAFLTDDNGPVLILVAGQATQTEYWHCGRGSQTVNRVRDSPLTRKTFAQTEFSGDEFAKVSSSGTAAMWVVEFVCGRVLGWRIDGPKGIFSGRSQLCNAIAAEYGRTEEKFLVPHTGRAANPPASICHCRQESGRAAGVGIRHRR
jgi:hypothetical protein